MLVVCIKNINNLIIGKEYTIQDDCSIYEFYYIEELNEYFDMKWFKTLEDIRDEKLKKLGI